MKEMLHDGNKMQSPCSLRTQSRRRRQSSRGITAMTPLLRRRGGVLLGVVLSQYFTMLFCVADASSSSLPLLSFNPAAAATTRRTRRMWGALSLPPLLASAARSRNAMSANRLRGGGGGGNPDHLEIREGTSSDSSSNEKKVKSNASASSTTLNSDVNTVQHNRSTTGSNDNHKYNEDGNHRRAIIISPSLLAADWSKVGEEIQRCAEAGLTHLHVDVFDGAFLDSPDALSFGPQMVKAMREVAVSNNGTGSSAQAATALFLDVHLCVDRPHRYIASLAKAGADRVIFQFEAMLGPMSRWRTHHQRDAAVAIANAVTLAKHIRTHGMRCGISINPGTRVESLLGLLEMEHGLLFDVVDVLAVEPGFGGQSFQPSALTKIQKLREWRRNRPPDNPMQQLQILVDGGINGETALLVKKAGADVLVAGTFLFRHEESLEVGLQTLLQEE